MPGDPSEKQAALKKKAEFAPGSLSDHFCALKAFQVHYSNSNIEYNLSFLTEINSCNLIFFAIGI